VGSLWAVEFVLSFIITGIWKRKGGHTMEELGLWEARRS